MHEIQEIKSNGNSIMVPGCRVTRTALIVDTFDEVTLIGVGKWLQAVEGSRAWWWGDFLNAYCEWCLSIEDAKERALAGADVQTKERYYTHYTGRYAEIAGVEAGTLKQWRCVAAFFKALSRLNALTWAHHQEAYHGCGGDLAIAQDWLAKAEVNNWSKTELRAAIRLAARRSREPDEPMPGTRFADLYAFTRWSRAQLNRISSMDFDEAEWIRKEIDPAARLIAELDARLKRAA